MTGQAQSRTAAPSLEERLKPWLDQGEFLIPLVLGLMAWAAGWVDLVGFQSPANPIIFGRYAPAFFAVLIAYTLGFGVWIWAIRSLRAIGLFKRGIVFVQQRPWLYVLAWAAFALVIWSMYRVPYWLALPLLEGAVLTLMVLFTAVVLLATPFPDAPFQRWRKIALGLLAALVAFELVLAGLAQLLALPFDNRSGLTVPYGRVYQTREGSANGMTNRYGWYAPEFRLRPGSTRVILSGDTYVQGLQVPMEAHMGQVLEGLIAQNASGDTEVLVQGQLGYGATMFVNPIMDEYIWQPMQPKEIVVFFHLANDFQLADQTRDPRPRYALDASGTPVVVDADFAYWHTLAHVVIAGHDPVNPIRTVLSHSLTLQTLLGLLSQQFGIGGAPQFPLFTEQANDAEPFGPASPLFKTNPDAGARQSFELAAAQIRTFAAAMKEQGVAVRVVTIPFVPEAAYATGDASGWSTTFGEYDLLATERVLEAAAHEAGVPFLAMGRVMQATGVTAEEVRSLFFDGGKGHLTDTGHSFFAQAIFDCFYAASPALDSAQGCVAVNQ
jgi:hypothetical protein